MHFLESSSEKTDVIISTSQVCCTDRSHRLEKGESIRKLLQLLYLGKYDKALEWKGRTK